MGFTQVFFCASELSSPVGSDDKAVLVHDLDGIFFIQRELIQEFIQFFSVRISHGGGADDGTDGSGLLFQTVFEIVFKGGLQLLEKIDPDQLHGNQKQQAVYGHQFPVDAVENPQPFHEVHRSDPGSRMV